MRRLILGGVVVAGLMVSPAAASAAGMVTGGPVKAAGYSVTLAADDAREGDTLTIIADRGTPADGESEILTFTKGVRVTVGRGSATIKGTLGRRGSVDLRLRATRTQRSKPPKGCTGSRSTTRTGRLEGRLRLRLANGKRITIRSLNGAIRGSGKLVCNPDPRIGGDGEGGDGGDGGGEPRLMLSQDSLVFSATKSSLELIRFEPAHRDGRAEVSVTRTVRASGSNLLAVSGGGATVRPAGAFSGEGVFTATSGGGAFASGPLTGSLKAGAVAIAGDDAILMNAG